MTNTHACSAHLTALADMMNGDEKSGREAEESVNFKSKHVRVRSETKRAWHSQPVEASASHACSQNRCSRQKHSPAVLLYLTCSSAARWAGCQVRPDGCDATWQSRETLTLRTCLDVQREMERLDKLEASIQVCQRGRLLAQVFPSNSLAPWRMFSKATGTSGTDWAGFLATLLSGWVRVRWTAHLAPCTSLTSPRPQCCCLYRLQDESTGHSYPWYIFHKPGATVDMWSWYVFTNTCCGHFGFSKKRKKSRKWTLLSVSLKPERVGLVF